MGLSVPPASASCFGRYHGGGFSFPATMLILGRQSRDESSSPRGWDAKVAQTRSSICSLTPCPLSPELPSSTNISPQLHLPPGEAPTPGFHGCPPLTILKLSVGVSSLAEGESSSNTMQAHGSRSALCLCTIFGTLH